MNSVEYLEEMKAIQEKLLLYLEGEAENMSADDIFKDKKFHDYLSYLHLVSKISNNHHRCENFFSKIKEILQLFKEDIKTKISNSQLFNIFKSNKQILLFLIEEGLLAFDEYIVRTIINRKYIDAKYPQYFQPEIQPFINKEWFPKYDGKNRSNEWVLEIQKEIPEDFYEKRKIGENDNYICTLIRKDLIDDFVVYVTKNNYRLNSTINPSIYETNNFLLKKKKELNLLSSKKENKNTFSIKQKNEETTLIEYAVFFGSIQIFNYLRFSGIELTPSLWLCAIHGKNADIIHILEENSIVLEEKSYEECLKESIKCHHNDIANYIQNQYLLNNNSNDIFVNYLKWYNFHFEQNDLIDKSSFCYLCEYDYYIFANFLLKEMDIDVNMKIIYMTKF